MNFKSLFVLLLPFGLQAHAATNTRADLDTIKKADREKFTPIDIAPAYPGGTEAFYRFLSKNLQYPGLAKLIGISGNVRVSFVVDQYGKVTDVTPVDCLGAGCESEAAKVVSMSSRWQPGIQNNRPVRVQYTVPINFHILKENVSMRELRDSDYGIVFEIKGVIYSIDEAQAILGKFIKSSDIEIAVPFSDNEKHPFPDKKEVYLLKIKS